MPDGDGALEIPRYFDNPNFWTKPGVEDKVLAEFSSSNKGGPGVNCALCTTTTKKVPIPDQYEMYNLSNDPLERHNLAYDYYSSPQLLLMRQRLAGTLLEQRHQKRLSPRSGNVSYTNPFDPHDR